MKYVLEIRELTICFTIINVIFETYRKAKIYGILALQSEESVRESCQS